MSSYSLRLCYRLARTSFSHLLPLPHLIFLLKTCIILLLLQLRRLRQLQRLQTLRHTHKCNTKRSSNSSSSNNTIITAPSTTSSRLTLHHPLHLHLRHLHLRLQHLHHLLCQTWHLRPEQIKDSLGCSSSSSNNSNSNSNSNISTTTYRHLREERAISRRNLQQSRHRSLLDVCNGAINNLIVILFNTMLPLLRLTFQRCRLSQVSMHIGT